MEYNNIIPVQFSETTKLTLLRYFNDSVDLSFVTEDDNKNLLFSNGKNITDVLADLKTERSKKEPFVSLNEINTAFIEIRKTCANIHGRNVADRQAQMTEIEESVQSRLNKEPSKYSKMSFEEIKKEAQEMSQQIEDLEM